jgi:hypothetical protein
MKFMHVSTNNSFSALFIIFKFAQYQRS